jgi:hypothetical protein
MSQRIHATAGYRDDGSFDRHKYVVDKMLRMTGDSPCASHAQMAHMLLTEADRIKLLTRDPPEELETAR